MLSALLEAIARLCRDRRGNIAITFGLAAVPVMLAVGASVDYTLANKAKAKLDAAADEAALAAASHTALKMSTTDAQAFAINVFNQAVSTLTDTSVGTVNATVTDSGNGRAVAVNYTASRQTRFIGIAGIKTMTISGVSNASSGIPTYIDFYLLLDNTPSMGVGATPTDVATMVNNTPDQCAFACHDLSEAPNDYYTLAKGLGVTMRIDVVRQAVQNLMDTATSTQQVPSQFRMAIYDFGTTAASAGLTRIFALSSSLSSAKTAAGTIDLMSVPYQNYNGDQDTDFDNALASMNGEISTPGDGTSSTTPQKILFFVSDGVADAYYPTTCSQPTTGGRCQEPLTLANCATLKNRGVKIAVLYTTYLALPTNAWYMSWIDPFNKGPYSPSVNSQIAQNMQSCASPGLYFEVSPTDGISSAMNALFQKAVQSARLTK